MLLQRREHARRELFKSRVRSPRGFTFEHRDVGLMVLDHQRGVLPVELSSAQLLELLLHFLLISRRLRWQIPAFLRRDLLELVVRLHVICLDPRRQIFHLGRAALLQRQLRERQLGLPASGDFASELLIGASCLSMLLGLRRRLWRRWLLLRLRTRRRGGRRRLLCHQGCRRCEQDRSQQWYVSSHGSPPRRTGGASERPGIN